MLSLDKILSLASFVFACVVILVAPWLFGAWEMWWFWPFAVCIFISTFFFSLRLIVGGLTRTLARRSLAIRNPAKRDKSATRPALAGSAFRILLSFLPFLAYALVRFLQAEVFMDAERSFLLFLTPFLLGVQIVFGFSRKQLKLLYMLILTDLCLLGLYGIINHFLTGSELVLWAEGYPQYVRGDRATGSYFCPDHFSGIMELALCLCLGLVLTRETKWRWRLFACLLSLIALWGVVLSKSRGGGLTVLVILFFALVWGFSQWPMAIRWYCRGSAAALLAAVLIVFCEFGSGYMDRFTAYFGLNQVQQKSFTEMRSTVIGRLRATSRGRMISGAIRAWKTSKIFGIGPGMHQNLWPHFAASPDGNRELGIWPTFPNNTFHSYEVHSDWVQLLEEYGLAGLFLFLLPVSTVFAMLFTEFRREVEECRQNNWQEAGRKHHAIVLGGLLACVCMTFHSLGDFNLQMPATVWLFAAIAAIPIGHILNTYPPGLSPGATLCRPTGPLEPRSGETT